MLSVICHFVTLDYLKINSLKLSPGHFDHASFWDQNGALPRRLQYIGDVIDLYN